jgi:hypothetical protein
VEIDENRDSKQIIFASWEALKLVIKAEDVKTGKDRQAI